MTPECIGLMLFVNCRWSRKLPVRSSPVFALSTSRSAKKTKILYLVTRHPWRRSDRAPRYEKQGGNQKIVMIGISGPVEPKIMSVERSESGW